jgi:hypothetical protein
MTSFGSTCPYFWLCLLFIWQDLQDLMYDWMELRITFQYITDLIVMLEVMVIPTDCPVLYVE